MKNASSLLAHLGASLGALVLAASLCPQSALAQAASAASQASPKSRAEVKSETAAAAKSGQLKSPEEGAIVGVANGKAARENTRALEQRSKAQEAAMRKPKSPRSPSASAPE